MAGIFLVLLKASFFTSGSVTTAVSMQKTWRIDFPRFSETGNAGFKQREADKTKEVYLHVCENVLLCVPWNILWKVYLFHLHKWLAKNWILSWDQWRDWTLFESNAFYRMQFPWCTGWGLSPKPQSWIFFISQPQPARVGFPLAATSTCWCSPPKPRSLKEKKSPSVPGKIINQLCFKLNYASCPGKPNTFSKHPSAWKLEELYQDLCRSSRRRLHGMLGSGPGAKAGGDLRAPWWSKNAPWNDIAFVNPWPKRSRYVQIHT